MSCSVTTCWISVASAATLRFLIWPRERATTAEVNISWNSLIIVIINGWTFTHCKYCRCIFSATNWTDPATWPIDREFNCKMFAQHLSSTWHFGRLNFRIFRMISGKKRILTPVLLSPNNINNHKQCMNYVYAKCVVTHTIFRDPL